MTPVTVARAATALVGSHVTPSRPPRRPIAGAFDERGLAPVHPPVAVAAAIARPAIADRTAPAGPFPWSIGTAPRAAVTVAVPAAPARLVGWQAHNPAMPNATARPAASADVLAITRHPTMWSFAPWAPSHAAIHPVAANPVPFAAIAVPARAGSALQDRRRAAPMPDVWPGRQAWAGSWPFAAIAAGRARPGDALRGLRSHAPGGGCWPASPPPGRTGSIAGWRVGIWHRIRQ